jgi:hypothetical protein
MNCTYFDFHNGGKKLTTLMQSEWNENMQVASCTSPLRIIPTIPVHDPLQARVP